MGFFDTVKDVATKSTAEMDKQIKKKMSKLSDNELLAKDRKSRYVREELEKRGL